MAGAACSTPCNRQQSWVHRDQVRLPHELMASLKCDSRPLQARGNTIHHFHALGAPSRMQCRETNMLTLAAGKLITGTEKGASRPVFSPDGKWIGYLSVSDRKLNTKRRKKCPNRERTIFKRNP